MNVYIRSATLCDRDMFVPLVHPAEEAQANFGEALVMIGGVECKVQGLVGDARRNFIVPLPRFASWEEFNEHLEAACRKRRECTLRGHRETTGESFEHECAVLRPLPSSAYEASA